MFQFWTSDYNYERFEKDRFGEAFRDQLLDSLHKAKDFWQKEFHAGLVGKELDKLAFVKFKRTNKAIESFYNDKQTSYIFFEDLEVHHIEELKNIIFKDFCAIAHPAGEKSFHPSEIIDEMEKVFEFLADVNKMLKSRAEDNAKEDPF